ncbi:hypothetical protein EVAR_72087_1 [Eumeta japonica]|uniref:DUF5641 domain-containing protein n=1 Tax=Eumeta variegata TaxID=151549 RepID=A0A4C1S9I3_EUMVA|nr:hypothetical protein EVAR_72087_1 [Eumeta japonica]
MLIGRAGRILQGRRRFETQDAGCGLGQKSILKGLSPEMRNKWFLEAESPKLGDLVLIKEDALPPLKCKYGRIRETLPTNYNIVRVVVIKTPSGTITEHKPSNGSYCTKLF